MFIVNVALGNTSWRLLFKDEAKALGEFNLICAQLHEASPIKMQDEFGQTFFGNTSAIHGVMFEDMDKTKMAHVEMALHQARTQGLATKMAQHDPALKAQSNMGGPSVLNPMGNGFRPPSN